MNPPEVKASELERRTRGEGSVCQASGLRWFSVLSSLAILSSGPVLAAEPDLDLFVPGNVRIQLQIGDQALSSLRSEPRKPVPAAARIDGRLLTGIFLRLKGSGSFEPIDQKPSLTLDLAQGKPRLPSLPGKIHLNNCVEDPTYIKDELGSEIFRAAGIPVPRITHARVELNGRSLGPYLLKEGVTDQFLSRHFGPTLGALSDRDISPAGADSTRLDADLADLAAAAHQNPGLRWSEFERVLDLDEFLNFMALEVLLCHWDGYCLARNNFRVYRDVRSNRCIFLPSGMDQLFSKPDLSWRPDMSGTVARALMETSEGREQYEARFRRLCDQVFVRASPARRAQELLDRARPVLGDEFGRARLESAELCRRIEARHLDLQRQLREGEVRCPSFENGLALVTEWKPLDIPPGGQASEVKGSDGGTVLRLTAAAATSASWRSPVQLRRGRYRFVGVAQVKGVRPLQFGTNQGACLRIEGRSERSVALVGSTGREQVAVDFEVEANEAVVVLICELRASQGEALFWRDSLQLRALD